MFANNRLPLGIIFSVHKDLLLTFLETKVQYQESILVYFVWFQFENNLQIVVSHTNFSSMYF